MSERTHICGGCGSREDVGYLVDGAIAALQEKLTAALKVKADYDRWLSGGVYFTTAEYEKHAEDHRQREAALQADVEAKDRRIWELESWLQVKSPQEITLMESKIIQLEHQLTQRTAERDTARRRVDELEAREVDVVLLREDLEKRTAELEAIETILDIDSGKTTVDKVRDLHHAFKQVWESYQDASNEMFKAQAELERVRGERDQWEKAADVNFKEAEKARGDETTLRTLIAALPKVEGEITANRVCTIMMHGLYCEEFTKLLQHRQGMEG